MTGTNRRQDSCESRYAQAAGWHVKLGQTQKHGATLSAREVQQAEQFYSDPENRTALDLLARVLSHADRFRGAAFVDAERGDDDDNYDGSVSVAEWRDRRPRERFEMRRAHHATVFGIITGFATAACVLVVLMIGYSQRDALPGQRPQVFRTQTAENQHITLADGSKVTLGARTEISVHFAPGQRIVHLQRGEALFAVAHDRSRPFTVQAGRGTVTAVGTQFNVRCELDRVTVTVTEGSVFVAPNTQGTDGSATADTASVRWQPVRLEQGQAVTYDESHERGSVEPSDPDATQWMAGRFQYRDVPLKYVVADLNRYGDVPIVLRDPAAGEYGFTGTVFLDHTGEWLLSLEKILPLQVSHVKRDGILIESRRTAESDTAANPR